MSTRVATPGQVEAGDDSTPHYISYNADTRVLNMYMYPNVAVLEDADVDDPASFARRLAEAPYYLRVVEDAWLVRQLFVRAADPGALSTPHACSQSLAKMQRVALQNRERKRV